MKLFKSIISLAITLAISTPSRLSAQDETTTTTPTDKTSLKIIDTPVGSSSSVSFSVNYQNSTNNVTLTADESSDVNNSFSISPTSKSIVNLLIKNSNPSRATKQPITFTIIKMY